MHRCPDERSDSDPSEALRLRRVRLLAVVLVAVVMVPFVQALTAQPAIRYAQTAAMVDHRTLQLDRYRDVVGIDRVERDGHVYSDKAPLQPLLAVPAYAIARAAGAEPATHLRVHGNLGLWWVTLWSTVVPLLLMVAVAITISSRAVSIRSSAIAAVVMALGTLLAAYGSQLYAHVLAGLLGWAAWLVLSRSEGGFGSAFLGGLLGGAAVATEYPLAIVVVVCIGVLVQQRSWKRLIAFCAGGVPAAALLLAYQWASYGDPFALSYGEKPVHESDPLVVGLPNPVQLMEVLFGSRGMFVFTPIVVVAVWGLWKIASQADHKHRSHAVVGLTVFALFLILQSGWSNPWGGEAPGPRYVVPALPFLTLGLAEAWERAAGRRRWSARLRLLVGWSVFAMMTTVLVNHLVPDGSMPVLHHLQRLGDEGPVDSLWSMAIGPVGWVLHVGSVIAALVFFVRGTAAGHTSQHIEARPIRSAI